MILKGKLTNELAKEWTKEQQEHWLDQTDQKFIANVDTLYLNCYIKGEYNEVSGKLISHLESWRSGADVKPFYIEKYDCFINAQGINFYPYMIVVKDCFRVVFMRKKFNADAVPIQIMLGSEFLWTHTEREAVDLATEWLADLLKDMEMEIETFTISRIDYAFHTNYIQNMDKFFPKLNEMQVSQFDVWQKNGRFEGETEDKLNTIYIGNRRGKNVFLRMYDKSEEVVVRGYKQFFYKIWKDNSLINAYDQDIYERCFKYGKNFKYQYIARLLFYLDHGSNENYKVTCRKYIDPNNNAEAEDIINFAKFLTPEPTLVMNIEYETMRKFYKSVEPFYRNLDYISNDNPSLYEVYRLLDNKGFILDYLTDKTFRLIDTRYKGRKKDAPMHPLWIKLRKEALKSFKVEKKLIRDYQKNIDLELMRKQAARKIATLSLYDKGENDDDLRSDISSYIATLGENTIREMTSYKKQKYRQIKNRIISDDTANE